MIDQSLAHPASHSTRELRALALYEAHGHRIEQIGADLFRVPSQDGQRSYDVRYGEREECPCPDHLYRDATCVHILALGVYHAKHRIRPELVADDPFHYAGRDRGHACYDGWVFLGRVIELPDGSEEVVHEPVRCRRCSAGEEVTS